MTATHQVTSASISYILERYNAKDLCVPPWQRRNEAWDQRPHMRSKLIETVLLELPIPPIWVVGSMESGVLTDGLQRITTFDLFKSNRLKLRLLEERPELNGKLYRDLAEDLQKLFRSYPLCYFALVTDSPYGDKIGQKMFDRLNEGITLSNVELLDGQNLGVGRDLVHELANNLGKYIGAARWDNLRKRKTDIAYTLSAIMGLLGEYRIYENNHPEEWGVWEKTMRKCGNNPQGALRDITFKKLNGLPNNELDNLKGRFELALHTLSEVFGDRMLGKVTGKGHKLSHSLTTLQFNAVGGISRPATWWAQNQNAILDIFKIVEGIARPDRKAFEEAYCLMRRGLSQLLPDEGPRSTVLSRFLPLVT